MKNRKVFYLIIAVFFLITLLEFIAFSQNHFNLSGFSVYAGSIDPAESSPFGIILIAVNVALLVAAVVLEEKDTLESE